MQRTLDGGTKCAGEEGRGCEVKGVLLGVRRVSEKKMGSFCVARGKGEGYRVPSWRGRWFKVTWSLSEQVQTGGVYEFISN